MTAERPLILVTSFEPFGGSAVNPTIRIAELLRGMPCAHGRRVHATLPVVTGAEPGSAWATLAPLVESLAPRAVVSLGESARADRVQLERIAVNLRDATIPDNAGTALRDLAVVDGAPDGRFATLPLRAMHAAIEAAGVPVAFSNSAGTYLCNETMFRLLDGAAAVASAARPAFLAGFIHVPQLPEQALARGGPSMDAATAARGVHAALEALGAHLAAVSEPSHRIG